MNSGLRPSVLITGCSEGGLGAVICHEFRDRGFRVFATVRDPSRAIALSQELIDVLQLDVTSTESIERCAGFVKAKTGGSLNVLVNNAGIIFEGPLLDVSLNESRKVYDVNLWGTLAVTQAFAPLLIEAKGSILNICSVGGAFPLIWQGIYNSSKAAQATISETLRIELEPLGVRVTTAMVGEVKTKIFENYTHQSLPGNSFYRAAEQRIADQAAGRLVRTNEAAEKTARNLVSDVIDGKTGKIWRGGSAGTIRLCLNLLPHWIAERMIQSGRGIDRIMLSRS